MFFNNRFAPLVVQNQTLGDVLQLGGGSKLGTIGAAMEHKGGGLAGLSALGPQESDDASGRNLTNIIERQFNGYGAEEVVEEHSVSNVTPSRLEEKMNMLNFGIPRNR